MRLLLVLTVTCAASCGGANRTPPPAPPAPAPVAETTDRAPGMLAHIPADTPYLMAAIEPIPRAWIDRDVSPIGPAFDKLVDEVVELGQSVSRDDLDAPTRLLHAAFAELRGKLSRKGLASLGIKPEVRYAIYGHGLLPAVRIELGDGALFEATIARIIRRAGVSVAEKRLGEQRYWEVPVPWGTVVAAVVGNELVAGLTTPTSHERILDLVLGRAVPELPLSRTEIVDELVERYALARYNVGFIDTVGVTERLVGRGRAPGDGLVVIRDERCAAELPELATAVPRIVGGVREFDSEQSSGSIVLELRDDVRARLADIVLPYPAAEMRASSGLQLDVGLGLRIDRAAAYLREVFRRVRDQPYRCPHLAVLNNLAQTSYGGLAAGQAPPFSQVTGIHAALSSFELLSGGKLGSIVVGTHDPLGLFAVLQANIPQLSGVTLTPGQAPIAVNFGPFPAVGRTFMGASDTALGVGLGDTTDKLLADGLASPPAVDDTFLLLAFDRGRWELMKRERERKTNPLLGKSLDEVAESEAQIFGRMAITGALVDHGIELGFVQRYR